MLGMDGVLDIAKRTFDVQDIEYYSKISSYATPIEFMVDLLNISSSKEFVNAFIDKMVKETEITLKLYRESNTYITEVTEETKEQTTVLCEAVVTAEVVGYDLWDDGVLSGYKTGDNGIKVESITLSEGSILWGAADSININIKFSEIPSNVNAFHVAITFKESGETKNVIVGSSVWDGIEAFFSCALSDEINVEAWFKSRFQKREAIATITEKTTQSTNESKLEIAVKEAKTWYGTFTFENHVKEIKTYEDLDNNGNRVICAADDDLIMNTRTKARKSYVKNNSNKDTIFKERKISHYVWAEVGSRIEEWYTDLDANDLTFFLASGGHLMHSVLTLYNDGGLQLYDEADEEGELLNIRLTYAMENGPDDWWLYRYYMPVEVEYKPTSYKIGYRYTTIENSLVRGVTQSSENIDFFLSLLKNSTGEYSPTEAYDPNGKEVVYETIYGTDARVSHYFETSTDMFFELLNSSPFTEGLTSVMKYIMYKYTTTDYGVTTWTFDIFDPEKMIVLETAA